MTGRIDVHSHLLPAVDDGCETVEESLACAREMVAAGYTHSFCTPHVWHGMKEQTVALVKQWVAALQEKLADANIPLTLIPGGEIAIGPETRQFLTPERLLTFGAHNQYCLVDLWADKLPACFEPTIRWLQSLGLTVILAHPERMRAVQLEPSLADYFDDLGLLLQGNLQCLADSHGSSTRPIADQYLTEGRYFLLGSDLHKLDTLGKRLLGLRNAIDLVGAAAVEKLTIENPRKLLRIEP
jgi:protein-tyrosine phosphatase